VGDEEGSLLGGEGRGSDSPPVGTHLWWGFPGGVDGGTDTPASPPHRDIGGGGGRSGGAAAGRSGVTPPPPPLPLKPPAVPYIFRPLVRKSNKRRLYK